MYGVASRKPERQAVVSFIAREIPIAVNGGPENEGDPLHVIALDKALYALPIAMIAALAKGNKLEGIIASDVNTFAGPSRFTKPLNKAEAISNMWEIGHAGHYAVRACTVFLTPNGMQLVREDGAQIQLDSARLKYLSTDAGFEDYLNAFNAVHPGLDITRVSSGISLETLLRLRAVTAINGQRVDYTNYSDPNLLRALNTVLTGISPELMRIVNINASDLLLHWPHLHQVAYEALKQ